MIDSIISVIGRGYTPVITELPDGTFDVSCDWAFIGCIALCVVALYCFLRIVGHLLCGDRR